LLTAEHLQHLEEGIVGRDPVLVIVDPVAAYMTGVDSHKDVDVRRVLRPLAKLAERVHAAIIGIMHLNKCEDQKALYRVGGSIGFVAAARSVVLVAKEIGGTGRNVFVTQKKNLAKDSSGLAYTLIDTEAKVAKVNWERLDDDLGADALLDAFEEESTKAPRRKEALGFLYGYLADGPKDATAVYTQAESYGLSKRTVDRAKEELGVECNKVGFHGGWMWSLPRGARGLKSGNLGNLGETATDRGRIAAVPEDCQTLEGCQADDGSQEVSPGAAKAIELQQEREEVEGEETTPAFQWVTLEVEPMKKAA
jgi:hypothetical protein